MMTSRIIKEVKLINDDDHGNFEATYYDSTRVVNIKHKNIKLYNFDLKISMFFPFKPVEFVQDIRTDAKEKMDKKDYDKIFEFYARMTYAWRLNYKFYKLLKILPEIKE